MNKVNISKVSILVTVISLVGGVGYFLGAEIQQYLNSNPSDEELHGPPILVDGFSEKLFKNRKPNESLIRMDRPALISDTPRSFRFVNKVTGCGFKVTEQEDGMYCFQEVIGIREVEYLSKKKRYLSKDQANIELESVFFGDREDKLWAKEEIRNLIDPSQKRKR